MLARMCSQQQWMGLEQSKTGPSGWPKAGHERQEMKTTRMAQFPRAFRQPESGDGNGNGTDSDSNSNNDNDNDNDNDHPHLPDSP